MDLPSSSVYCKWIFEPTSSKDQNIVKLFYLLFPYKIEIVRCLKHFPLARNDATEKSRSKNLWTTASKYDFIRWIRTKIMGIITSTICKKMIYRPEMGVNHSQNMVRQVTSLSSRSSFCIDTRGLLHAMFNSNLNEIHRNHWDKET